MQKNLATWKEPSIFIPKEKEKLFFVERKGEDLSLYSIPLSRFCIQSLDLTLVTHLSLFSFMTTII